MGKISTFLLFSLFIPGQFMISTEVPLSVANRVAENETDPMINTRWDQGCFYNFKCPVDTLTGTCYHVYAGCGAIAMAQIMKYYNFPSHGTGDHGYNHPTYGYLYADFGVTNYDWTNMPDSLTANNDAIATLIYHCGVAQDMNYGSGESVSIADSISMALKTYFNYASSAQWKWMENYSILQWDSMLRAELDAGRPLLYYGADSNNQNGYFFNCDGYSGNDFFHFNWCRSGVDNGYFYLNDLTPESHNFSWFQGAIFNLHPDQVPQTAFTMDFESTPDFSLAFSPWTTLDKDGSATFEIVGETFPHSGEPFAFISFNPAQVTPPMTDPGIQPHSGSRFGACFSDRVQPNNDWFISPRIHLDTNGSFSFWVKSFTARYGLEKYKIGVSTTDNNPGSFTFISGPSPLLADTFWTKKTVGLSAYNNRQVYLAIQCVSDTAFIFMIDDMAILTGDSAVLADFSADKTNIPAGGSVNFTDQSDGSPTSWLWSFSGGSPSISNSKNPSSIVYANPGNYDVTLTVNKGTSSDTKTRNSYINVSSSYPSFMSLDFESLADFTLDFSPWYVADVNGGGTYIITDHHFPNDGDPFSFIAFNPGQVNPPMTDTGIQPHSGHRFGACFSSPPPYNPNNKWLISPKMHLGPNPQIGLWVKTYNLTYGYEKYNIGVSTTTNNPTDFTVISGPVPLEAPADWSYRQFNLADYTNQDVYLGIQCVSDTAFIFMVDDIQIGSSLFVEEIPSGEWVTLCPNPAQDKIFINFGARPVKNPKIILFNNMGIIIGHPEVPAEVKGSIEFRLPPLTNGIYYLSVSDEKRNTVKKIIIEK